MKVAELKQALVGVPDDVEVVFQGNEPDDPDCPEEGPFTSVLGTVFSAFERNRLIGSAQREFVIDGTITDFE